MTYFLAPSLDKFRDQINAKWPNRDKASDGWIGDTSHSARVSDHNPDYADGGIVRALDIDEDGIDSAAVVKAAIHDPRVAYVIYEGRIWGGSRWRKYTGTNMHTKHIHVSIKHTAAAAKGSAWNLGGTPKPKPPAGKGWPAQPLPMTGSHTDASHDAWVELMAAIGYKDKKLGLALQKWLSNLTDPRTGNGYYDTGKWALDGNFSTESVKALQRKLYDTKSDKGKRLYNGKADGKRYGMTIKAEIGYLNLKANRGL